MAFYVNQSMIGVDLNNPNAASSFALLTRVNGSADSAWVYVYMSGACSAGAAVVISATGTAAMATIALAMAPANEIAFAQNAFSAADYGWVCNKGMGVSVEMSATSAAVTTALYVGTVAGHLSTTVGSATVFGVQVPGSSATAAVYTATGTVSWPRIGNANLTDS